MQDRWIFGHWLAHRIEMDSQGQLRHGEAVAIGVLADSYYALQKNQLNKEVFQQLHTALKNASFALWHDSLMLYLNDSSRIEDALNEFREHLGGKLHITLPNSLGKKNRSQSTGHENYP